MNWGPLLAAMLAAAPPAAADPELQALNSSLAASQRAAVESAVGSLAALPRYRLDLELDPDARLLKGKEQIALTKVKEDLKELWLRVPANATFNDRGQGPAVSFGKVAVDGHNIDLEPQDNGVYRLSLETVAPGANALVEIELSAAIPELTNVTGNTPNGLMAQAMSMVSGGTESRTDYGAFGCFGKVCTLAGFAPEIARRDAGVFDTNGEAGIGEPRWGALGNWVVSLVAPASRLVAGTGVEVGATPERDGRKRTTRAAAAVRGFALLAGEGLQEQKMQSGETLVRVLAAPGHALQAKKALDTASRALKFYSEKAGAYPWAQLDIAEAPLTGAMEAISFPTCVLISGLLTDTTVTASMTGKAADGSGLVDNVLEMAVAHHVAHQWWKGVVGSDNRGRPALDEPLTSYAAILYVEQRRGAGAAQKLVEEQLRRAYRLYRTLGKADAAVDRPLNEYEGRMEVEALLRGKGGTYYAKARKLVGDKAFFAALKQSVAHNRFKDVDTDPWLIAVAGAAPDQAEAALKLYERFMRQKKGDEDIGAQLDAAAFDVPGMQVDPATLQIVRQMLKSFSGSTTPDPVPVAPPTQPPPKQHP